MELSPKERRFVAEFLKDQDRTKAAKRAGYAPKFAQQQGSRLYRKVLIREAIDAGLKRVEEKCELDATLVRQKVLELLTFDPRKAFNSDGTMKSANEMPDEIVVALAGIETTVDDDGVETSKIRFNDRVRAAELAAKILGMLKIEVTGKDGRPLATPTMMQIDFSRINDDMLRVIAGMRVSGNGHKS